MTQADRLTRRGFVVVTGAGLTLAWGAPVAAKQAARAKHAASTPPVVQPFVQPFVQIATDSRVTVLAKHLDMGQGIWTGLSTIVAEELDADWSQMRVEGAPADTAVYKHLMFGAQSTGGSTSIANSWDQLRRAGATARAMLVQAAAQRWKVPAAEVQVAKGVVSHGKHRASFGDLAGEAAALPVPAEVVLKDPSRFTLIGSASGKKIPRLDAHAKSHGAPIYGIDAERPGMRYAVLQRPPRFGARLKNVDDRAARALPGVIDIVRLPNAVAVIASNTWAAIEARRVLAVEWDETNAEKRGSVELMDEFRRLARSPWGAAGGGTMGTTRGDSAAALAGATRVIEAEYEAPYLAHASLEPLCSVGEWRDGRCDIWAGIQNQTGDQRAVARILDLPIDKVALNTLYAGGSFGRRATFSSDWIGELAQVLKATRGAYPVKLMWTREDDLHGGYYRPMNLHRLRAALGPDGRVLAVEHTIVAQSFGGQPKPGVAQRLDRYAVEGNVVERYDIPNASLRWFNPAVGVPVHTFRALSFNHTTFAKEVFMDELAKAAGRDPLEFRLAHLGSHPRQAAVLRLAADKAGWGRPLPAGSALGLSVQEANSGTFVAQVAQVRLLDGRPQVERVVCAVDCGVTLNPDIVRSQAEGGVADGLWQALHGRITLAEGRVEQTNFNDYPLLRLPQMPQVELHLLDGGGPPMGVGEPCSVPIGAAVANALVQLGGAPVRRLPMTTQT